MGKNTAILLSDPGKFEQELTAYLEKKRPEYFRYDVAGEILNAIYLSIMIRTAEHFPETTFWTYSKNPRALMARTPRNLIIMDSTGFGKPFNPTQNRQFHCVKKGEQPPAGVMECPNDCTICQQLKIGCVAGMNVYAHEH